MIWGLSKNISRLAIVAIAGAMYSTAAMSADLGGNCCADLEERVAELEATTARKGNRKVSLTVSGSVAHSIIWHDSDAANALRSGRLSGTDSRMVNQSAFKFTGSAQINADWSAGFKMQIDVDSTDGLGPDDVYLYIKSKRYGTVQFGRLEGAMDGINAISLGARPDIAMDDDTNIAAFIGSGYFVGGGDYDGSDDRGVGFKYVSPSIAGFSLSASWVSDESADPATGFTGTEWTDIWGVALRYAGEFGAFRVAAGIGYEQTTSDDIDASGDVNDQEVLAGSISVMHVPSGIFVNFAAGTDSNTETNAAGALTQDTDRTSYHALVGIKTKLTSLGATTFSAHVNWHDNEDNLATGPANDFDSTVYGFGIVQSVDAAAMSMYLNVQQYECVQATGSCTDDATVVSAGAGIKF